MSDRGIIFSVPMVQALLAGRKTQTRRLATSPLRRVEPGDRLYVRETWQDYCPLWGGGWCGHGTREGVAAEHRPAYFADPPEAWLRGEGDKAAGPQKWRPSIHMPRWASRLTLIVEVVRFDPLQTITEADAIAEGVEPVPYHGMRPEFIGEVGWRSHETCADGSPHPHASVPNRSPVTSYRELWDSLHRADGQRWQDNPDVVALTFRVERRNIDAAGTL